MFLCLEGDGGDGGIEFEARDGEKWGSSADQELCT